MTDELELRWLDRNPRHLSTPMIRGELERLLRRLGKPVHKSMSLRALADAARALDRADPVARRASTLAGVLFDRLG